MSWLREPGAEPLTGYKLISPLGTGGFGEVWLCNAPGDILKAIKFVYGSLYAEDGGDIRAEQEHKALERVKNLRHPFVLTIERIDILPQGEVAIVMELADKSLHDCMQDYLKKGPVGIPRNQLLNYLKDAAEGLDFLNKEHGLLHLDVKPKNLFLIGNHVKVADFGLVKPLDRQGASGFMGGMTPQYAAPEIFQNNISRQADQYSLAIVYMELLTGGHRPFTGRNLRQLALQHMSEEPDLRALAEADRIVVARALAKDPAKRFPNCEAFVRALITAGGGYAESVYQHDEPPLAEAMDAEGDTDHKTVPTIPRMSAISVEGQSWRPGLDDEKEGLSQPITQAHVVGTLQPTLVIGLGGFGRMAMLEVRSRLLDRLGDLNACPAFRFLYLEPDQAATEKALSGHADEALRPEQVFPVKLQPISAYRKRLLEHLAEWLPQEKLFSLPRSLSPQGSRALARLGFCDNYLRFEARVTREVQIATHPESLGQTMTQTGMSLRENSPRVFVLAGAGGSSSGMLADLGYAMRRRLTKLNFPNAQIHLFLFCGAPHDPVSPKSELANIYATLTELNHFCDPAISFSAQYGGPDGPRLVEQHPPFSSIYLMQRDNRGPDALSKSAAQLGSYLAQDLTTALGPELDLQRAAGGGFDRTPFRSFGASGVWFPRGLMLRSAARLMCQQLLTRWQEPRNQVASGVLTDMCNKVRARRDLQPAAVRERIEELASQGQTALSTILDRLFDELDVSVATMPADTAAWAKMVLDKVLNWVGSNRGQEQTSAYLQSRMARGLTPAVQEVTKQWVRKLSDGGMRLLEVPGRRLALTEEALDSFAQIAAEFESETDRQLGEQMVRSEQAWVKLQGSLKVCVHGGGFRLFGARGGKDLRSCVEDLKAYATARKDELLSDATVRTYHALQVGLQQKLQDLSFCRQRLTHLQDACLPHLSGPHPELQNTPVPPMEEKIGNEQVILPFGEKDVEAASSRFVRSVTQEQWQRLEEVLQSLVLAPQGGLQGLFQQAGDLIRRLAGPIIDQTAAYLDNLMISNDLIRAAFKNAMGEGANLLARVMKCHQQARPQVAGSADNEKTYLLVPDSDLGDELTAHFGDEVRDARVLRETGFTSDVIVCREQGNLRGVELDNLLIHCREGYQELSMKAATSPHSRFDILEWMPLEV